MVAVPDAVRRLVGRSCEPERVRAAVRTILDDAPELAEVLAADPMLRRGAVAVVEASSSLARWLGRDPWLLESLAGDDLATDADAGSLEASWRMLTGDAVARLRRWKRRELVRIVARDMLGLADLPTVVAELSALADGCLVRALTEAEPAQPMAVIGLGKLGGRELNYCSDVDLIVVHEGDDHDAAGIVRRVISLMATQTPDGRVWPVDLDLRPEGRDGAVTRSPDSYEQYYRRWGEAWELQALIKARYVAGDVDLANRFFDAVRPMVWHEELAPGAVPYIHQIKRRHEEEFWSDGRDDGDVKRGRGGIRDVEFTAQILQLVHGRADPAVRSPNTFEALDQLVRGGYLHRGDARRLAGSLVHLRTVEHRLQLWEERQTHHLPDAGADLDSLARRLGYRGDRPGPTFLADHEQVRAAVRDTHERVFYRPVLDAVAGAGALAERTVADRLEALGFTDVAGALERLERITEGSGSAARALRQLLPPALDWLGQSPDPDLGLFQLRLVTDGTHRASLAVEALREDDRTATRLCRVLGSSRIVGDGLRAEPELMPRLGDDSWLDERYDPDAARAELAAPGAQDRGAMADRLAVDRASQTTRIAIADLLGRATLEETGSDLTRLAETHLDAALEWAAPRSSLAIVGLGRFGGGNLAYPSDLDVVFVHEESDTEAPAVVRRLLDLLAHPVAMGRRWEVDTRLRPEGANGRLVRSIDEMVEYYRRWADTWERQAMLKARPVAGNRALGGRFVAALAPILFGPDFSSTDEIREMKDRIEAERISDDEDPALHLKLGEGSLTDVEFAVQVLRLRHGHAHPGVRRPDTEGAVEALVDAGLLAIADAEALVRSYRFCGRARNLNHLMKGGGGDALPADHDDARHLGRLLGFEEPAGDRLRDDYRRITAAARVVARRVLGG